MFTCGCSVWVECWCWCLTLKGLLVDSPVVKSYMFSLCMCGFSPGTLASCCRLKMLVRLIGDSYSLLYVSSMVVCHIYHIWLAGNQPRLQPYPSPSLSCDQLQRPMTQTGRSSLGNEWMVFGLLRFRAGWYGLKIKSPVFLTKRSLQF